MKYAHFVPITRDVLPILLKYHIRYYVAKNVSLRGDEECAEIYAGYIGASEQDVADMLSGEKELSRVIIEDMGLEAEAKQFSNALGVRTYIPDLIALNDDLRIGGIEIKDPATLTQILEENNDLVRSSTVGKIFKIDHIRVEYIPVATPWWAFWRKTYVEIHEPVIQVITDKDYTELQTYGIKEDINCCA